MQLGFPRGFLWGAATAAHQVEGDNRQSDFWALEQAIPSFFREPSGAACDHYRRFGEDIAMLARIGLTAYRFSVEWARIEPAAGCFSPAALGHYQRCIDACRANQVRACITFQHFTLPLWQARRGGFTDPAFADNFARFCEHTARHLSGFDMAFTINELNLPALFRDNLLKERTHEGAIDRLRAAEDVLGGSVEHLFLAAPPAALLSQGLLAHARGRDAIKEHHPHTPVGVTLAIQDEQAEPGAEHVRDQRCEDIYQPYLEACARDDFIGVQAYTRVTVRRDGSFGPQPGHRLTVMGYEDRPQALAQACRYVRGKCPAPIVITENGWAGEDDRRRCAFIEEALKGVHRAIAEGVDIRGYFYWSLLDNFEWLLGYGPKFGLIGVDRITQQRTIRPSAVMLGAIARRNAIAPGEEAS